MKYKLLILLAIFSTIAYAQGDADVNKSIFTSDLKIYVVVAVLAIILLTIFVFLFSMERRIKRLEEKK